MGIWMWIADAVLLVLLLLVASRRAAGGSDDPTQLLLDPVLMFRVRSLAESGQKVQAIASLRTGTPGLGLAAAKALVDRMSPAGRQPGSPAPAGTYPAAGAPQPGTAAKTLRANDSETIDRASQLNAAGEQIQPVKLVLEGTGCGLRQAKDFVDGL